MSSNLSVQETNSCYFTLVQVHLYTILGLPFQLKKNMEVFWIRLKGEDKAHIENVFSCKTSIYLLSSACKLIYCYIREIPKTYTHTETHTCKRQFYHIYIAYFHETNNLCVLILSRAVALRFCHTSAFLHANLSQIRCYNLAM